MASASIYGTYGKRFDPMASKNSNWMKMWVNLVLTGYVGALDSPVQGLICYGKMGACTSCWS